MPSEHDNGYILKNSEAPNVVKRKREEVNFRHLTKIRKVTDTPLLANTINADNKIKDCSFLTADDIEMIALAHNELIEKKPLRDIPAKKRKVCLDEVENLDGKKRGHMH